MKPGDKVRSTTTHRVYWARAVCGEYAWVTANDAHQGFVMAIDHLEVIPPLPAIGDVVQWKTSNLDIDTGWLRAIVLDGNGKPYLVVETTRYVMKIWSEKEWQEIDLHENR